MTTPSDNSPQDPQADRPLDALRDDPAPAHGPHFWDNVRGGLADGGATFGVTPTSATPPEAAEATQVHAAVPSQPAGTPDPTQIVPAVAPATAAATPTPATPTPAQGEVQPTSLAEVRERRSAGRGPFLAAVAAIVLVVGGTIGYLSLRDSGGSDTDQVASPDVQPSPTEITQPTPTVAPVATAVVLPTATPAPPTPVPTPQAISLGETPNQLTSFWLQPIDDTEADPVCDGKKKPHRILVSSGPEGDLGPSGTDRYFGEIMLATVAPEGTAFISTCDGILHTLEVGLEPNDGGPFGAWASLGFGPEIAELRDLRFTSPTSMIGDALTTRTSPPGTEVIEINLTTGAYLLPVIGVPDTAVLIGATNDGAYEYYANPVQQQGCEGEPPVFELLVRNAQGVVSSATSQVFASVSELISNGKHAVFIERCEEGFSIYVSPVAEDGSLPNPQFLNDIPNGRLDSINFNSRGEIIVRGDFFLGTSSYADGFLVNAGNRSIIETWYGISPADPGAVPFDELLTYDDTPVAVSRDGRFTYFFAEHPSAPVTCEGANATLFAVDQRNLAAPAFPDQTSPVIISSAGPGDRLALGTSCEGQQADVWVVKVGTDGRMTIQDTYALAGAGYVTALEWDDEALHVRVFTDTLDGQSQEFDIDHDSGTVTEIDI